jgi:hypothetical protein
VNEQRDKSDRLVIDFHHIKAGMYSKVTDDIIDKFGLEVVGEKTIGLDEVFQDFSRGDMVLSLEWDNWSGYSINAKSASAEQLVREIASYTYMAVASARNKAHQYARGRRGWRRACF